jgi:urease accessory protein
MNHELTTLRVLQLASPALPIGAYNFSQGLEQAAEQGWVHDEQSLEAWIRGLSHGAMRRLDLPVLQRLHSAWRGQESAAVAHWDRLLVASRESSQLRAEERHLGRALAKVLVELEIPAAAAFLTGRGGSYATLFALACVSGGIGVQQACQAYLWAWSENQVMAALKLLPIGQSSGQRVLNRVLRQIPALCEEAALIEDDDIGVSTPLHAMACAWHETQYSRLFRS